MVKAASIMNGGQRLERRADSFLGNDEGEGEHIGSGVDEIALYASFLSDFDLKLGIMQFSRMMNSETLVTLLEGVCELLGISAADVQKQLSDPSGKPTDNKLIDYIAQSTTNMDTLKLRTVFCNAKRLI